MKKLFTNSNPFILLLIPVLFALIMGISYQFEQKKQNTDATASVQATSLFIKGVTLIKTVCSISKETVW
jgi:cytochrome c biogenesis protein CcdA